MVQERRAGLVPGRTHHSESGALTWEPQRPGGRLHAPSQVVCMTVCVLGHLSVALFYRGCHLRRGKLSWRLERVPHIRQVVTGKAGDLAVCDHCPVLLPAAALLRTAELAFLRLRQCSFRFPSLCLFTIKGNIQGAVGSHLLALEIFISSLESPSPSPLLI